MSTSLSRIAHMTTLLINTSSNITPIPFFSNNNYSIYNPNGIEIFMIKEALVNQYVTTLNVNYNAKKDI